MKSEFRIRMFLLRLVLLIICALPSARVSAAIQADEDFPPIQLKPFSESGSSPAPSDPPARQEPPVRPAPRDRDSGNGREIRLNPVDEPLDDRMPAEDRESTFGPGDDRESTQEGTVPRTPGSIAVGEFNPAIPNDEGFDWTLQPVSIADLEVGRLWPFQHGKPNLNDQESAAYAELIQAAIDKRSIAPASLPGDVSMTGAWESAFYRYAEVRRQAWMNRAIVIHPKPSTKADPFAEGTSPAASLAQPLNFEELTAYSLQLDMQSNPAHFVARPVAIYGMFTPSGVVEMEAVKTLEGEDRLFRMQRGLLKNLQGTETLALVDAISYVDPEDQTRPSTAWPLEKRVQLPVLVKGWFVKLWGQRPLIFAEVVRILTPRPYDQYVREHVRSRRRVSEDEAWLYYETLRQLQVTNGDVQGGIALAEQQARVRQLAGELQETAAEEKAMLDQQLRKGTLTRSDEGKNEGYDTKVTRLDRQLSVRLARHERYQKDPTAFPLFVDVFRNPSHWQGRLITLRGHVRQVITHPGDSTLFQGQPLHELWLYTEDSQHIPTVIVTPSLPQDFPVGSDLIESVTVTGCFFKMYAYRSQDEGRLAPLVLAGHVQWKPSPSHVLALAKDGLIPAESPLIARARSADPLRVSETAILFLGFIALLLAMTVWGRVQRDRRHRKRVLHVVDERPDFRHTSQDLFSGPFADSQIEPRRG